MFLKSIKQFFLKNKLQKILKKYPIVFAYVFGSFAKEKSGPLSDFDIAVFVDLKISEEKRDKIRFDIKDDIEKILRNADVVTLNNAEPFLEKEVVYNGKVLYTKDDNARKHYEADVIGRWLDWEWYDKQFIQSIKKNFGKPIKPYLY
ncbi:MAG: nucleotidyltransferase domain-containing protein [Patescibacteria group bacterium]